MKNFSFPSLNEVESFRNTLNSEQGVYGPFMITGDPAFVECAGYAGYDFVLLDMEHGPVSFERLQNLIRAANIAKIMPVVRVPRGSDIFISRALDVGAGAILVPQIDSAEQAAAAVSAAKFSPIGTRGTCRFTRSACYGADSGKNYFHAAQDTMVMIQAEGTKAIENIDAILNVDGIDVIFIGPYDLSASLGIIGQIEHPEICGTIQEIVQKADKKGIKVGCFANDVAMAQKWRSLGVRFIGYSCDTNIFFEGAKRDVAIFHTQV